MISCHAPFLDEQEIFLILILIRFDGFILIENILINQRNNIKIM